MALKTQTKTGSAERVIRTAVQVLVALVATAPLITSTLGLTPAETAKVLGIMGAAVIVVAALHNGLEAAGILPAMLRGMPVPTPTPAQISAASVVAPVLVEDSTKAQAIATEVAPVIAAVRGSQSSLG
ncbi:MAG: hypothetical protein ACYDHP_00540 [Ferrimicrobium sp.]